MSTNETEHGKGRLYIVLCGFLLVAAFFLWTEHRAHLVGILPYVIFLACPLMHVFHHRGHSAHRDVSRNERPS